MSDGNSAVVAYTIFCDDLRPEVGNKVSYMGVYQGTMFVENFPVALPKLCAAVFVRLPTEVMQRPRPLIFRILSDESVIAERSFEPDFFAASAASLERAHDIVYATAYFQFAPFAADAPMHLKSRVYFDDCEFKAGSLQVRQIVRPEDLAGR